jgi:flagellar hook-basal body protein
MSFYTSLTGLNAATTELSVTSNNIANSGTAGFKRSSASFGDIFATSPLQRAAAVVGQGVALKEISQEFSQGFVQFSSNSLDLAITGDGFFPLQSSDGTRVYTRNGSFMLNEQNQMVNSAGQALQSLPVDSTNKADFSQSPSALSIPRQTVSEFRATTEVELGLNLPSNVEPINVAFNPGKPETYHRTTSLTVYGASGSQHLATIYYVKTQNATADTPQNKWQTHVYIDGKLVDSELIQAAEAGNDPIFVNKYGERKTASELEYLQKTSANSSEYLVTQGTVYRKYSFDKLGTPIESTPATVSTGPESPGIVEQLSQTGGQSGYNLSTFSRADLRDMMSLSVDGSSFVSLGLEHLYGSDNLTAVSGQTIAEALTRVANERFGDGLKFDMSSYLKNNVSTGNNIQLTRNYGLPDEQTFSLDIGAALLSESAAGDIVFDPANPQLSHDDMEHTLNAALVAAGVQTTDIRIEYNLARQGLNFIQGNEKTLHVTSSLPETTFGLEDLVLVGGSVPAGALDSSGGPVPAADNDPAIKLLPNVVPAGDAVLIARDQRYGIKVSYFDGKFSFSSGTTGDSSSIAVRNFTSDGANPPVITGINNLGSLLFGLDYDAGSADALRNEGDNTLIDRAVTSAIANRPAVRGTGSEPAKVTGNQMGVDPNAPFQVTADNRSLTVIVDNISAQIELDLGPYQIGEFTKMVQKKINLMADNVGRQVSGVTVGF